MRYVVLWALACLFLLPVYVLVVTSFKDPVDVSVTKIWDLPTSLSLDNFALVNLARTSLPLPIDDGFYLAMVQALVSMHFRISDFSNHPEDLVYACSSAEDEVGYVWSLPPKA